LRAAGTTGGRRDIGALRWVTGLVLAAGAALLVLYVWSNLPGPDPKDYDPSTPLLAIVASGGLAYFALVSLGPVLVRPLLVVVGWPLRRFGPVGRLAVGGVGGAPRRAAAVSVVVALGVTLIAGVVVGGASVRVLANAEAAQSAPADYEVTANADTPLTTAMVDQARASADLTRVTPYRRVEDVTITVADSQSGATDLDLASVPLLANLAPKSGSLADLRPGTMAISSFTADVAHLAVGDTAPVHTGKATVALKVVAVFPSSAPLNSGVLVTSGDLTKLGAPATYSGMLADAAKPGETGRTAGRQALKQITGNTGGLGVSVLADKRDEINKDVDSVLAVAIGLVGLTVLIAVVGVGTTSALSVVERVRESGLLRAVGLSRAGLRTMLTAESALYGVIGAAVGLLLGVPYAWLAVKALGERLSLELPVGQLAVVFVVLVAFTALAGVLPARRAARVSPVAALGVDG
jgi:putative ABC transport system permease protein